MNNFFLTEKKPEIISEGELHRHSVAIAFPDDSENDEILFEVRSGKIRQQPGDICLPGGSIESNESPEQAVIREITEELLIPASSVQIIGEGDTFVSGLLQIHTFACRISGYTGTYNPDEVAEIFRVPLSFFKETRPQIHEITWHPSMDDTFPFDKIVGGRNYAWRERRSQVRFYEYQGRVIWGITARILENFAIKSLP